ncbi:5853_t:CDS:2 [Diversispora eburnea]|uniref:5853_t:CDS:1 n=1 Tax=Diversispora eburnea TaxID=1213867 RepID=A0A9N8VAJ4_9GLOM|nr:5853_t:CDS:2 [Diversispora eburnea]
MLPQSARSIRKKRNINLILNSSPIIQQQQPPRNSADDGLSQRLTDLEFGLEFRLDLKSEDLIPLKELGAGNGGTVSQVMHVTTKTVMAKKKNGPVPLGILGKITLAVLEGLNYLYESHRIIHRDVKPSNILVNSKGQIKICDFGVSGQLINSIADTFVGTSNYMSPERIQGASYSVRSDVWSVGITLMELALGRFPFPPDGSQLTVLELLQHIVNEPAPMLPAGEFPEDFRDLVGKCLIKDVNTRPSPNELLKHAYVKASAEAQVDVEAWAKCIKR